MAIILKTLSLTAMISRPKSICIEKISPRPSLPKRGINSSLWQREVRRDFITECSLNFATLNNLSLSEEPAPGRVSQ